MTPTEILDLPLAEIDVPPTRARDLSPDWAQGLAALIAAQGLTNPITVRQAGSRYQLVTGMHRLEAFRILGRETIPARLSTSATDDDARLEEVMEHLGRTELNALDRCHHLYELKQVWERMYPQAKHGGDRKSDAIKSQSLALDPDAPEIFGFAKGTADRIGLGVSSIKAAVRIWTRLYPPLRRRLAGTAMADKQTELKALSELDINRQVKVLDLILSEDHPEVGNVAEALLHLASGTTPSALERRIMAVTRSIAGLDDPTFDSVIAAHEDRGIASLKRRGRI